MAVFATSYNVAIIDELYKSWKRDPQSVDERWQAFFEGFDLAGRRPEGSSPDPLSGNVLRLIYAYRELGHYQAHLDPLSDSPQPHPQLDLGRFNLSPSDFNETIEASTFSPTSDPRMRLGELVSALKQTYSRTIGVEYFHIQDPTIRQWLRDRMEPRRNMPNLPVRQKLRVLMTLHYAELFEKFLHTRYVGQKRFSLEGAETVIPILDAIVEKAPSVGIREFVIGMAHRGRLNVLANILRKPYQDIFAEFEDNFLPDSIDGDGDVKYHLGFSENVQTTSGGMVHLSLTPNPSHLEAVNPVVEGRVRAKQRIQGDTERKLGVPLLIHGDAAFAGQGIVAETLNLSNLAGYSTGGTVHVVINNQIGFTTSPSDARSTPYCTDVAKMIQAPIFHVNADDPEAAVFIAELALEFRQTYNRDVIIDLYCYRKHGHNEGDEPTFTQPLMYEKIKGRPSTAALYTQQLVKEAVLKQEEADAIDKEFQSKLGNAQEEMKKSPPRKRGMKAFTGGWEGMSMRYSHEPVDTSVSKERLVEITEHITRIPEGFNANPKIVQILEKRYSDVMNNRPLDWAMGEALAFGTLIQEGSFIRLSGQDSRRGTFSHRHSVLVDVKSGERYVPLDTIPERPNLFKVFDSLLSESAVLGFDFGYSLDAPHSLVMWEAQFGDFANGAQIIIDQFIVCSESKWQRSSGLVMLLPHGYEGQGPEHSSARLERFLQACAEDNIQVCNFTTPAQLFHGLRRQLHREFRKPLIVMTPKSLLRHKEAVSPIEAFTQDRFREILDDAKSEPSRVRRIILCSGKVFYDLLERRNDRDDVALVRMEQIYPFPEQQLREVITRYPNAREYMWVQEESKNMGAWSFVDPFMRKMGYVFHYIGRDASASPAVGSLKIHQREQRELVEAAFAGLGSVEIHSFSSSATSSASSGLKFQ
jgi:2-oxoglutarate dehydrogenase E1 component